MSLYANINVAKAQEKVHAVSEPSKKPSKSAALYADVQARPPPQKTAVARPVPAPASNVIDLIDEVADKNTEALALQFKPTIRRIQKPVKGKGVPPPQTEAPAAPIQSASKSFLQDVSKLQEDIANDDVNGFYRTTEGQKIARKNAKKKKRKNNDGQGTYIWSWDYEYDPAHPNDYETYLDSDEQLREQIEWQRKLEGKEEYDEEEEEGREYGYKGFAPPEDYEEEEEEEWVPPVDDGKFVPAPVVDIAMDESGDDVYARRMRMAQEAGLKIRPPTPPPQEKDTRKPGSTTVEDYTEEEMSVPQSQQQRIPSLPPPSPPSASVPPPPPNPPSQPQQPFSFYDEPPSLSANAPGMQPTPIYTNPTISSAPVYYPSATISSEPVHYTSATISSDPVFYDRPAPLSNPSDDESRGSHPGQKDFASRLMSKYGWEKGQSLGSSTKGLVTPLVAKHDKDRKGTGTIINRNKVKEDYGPHGKMTRCIVLANVVGLGEVDEDLADEIGQECREKYGEVERIRVVEDPRAPKEEAVRVFVLFTSELSALRGVNALDGRLFGGRKVKARFYDVDKFEDGDFRLL